MRYPGALKGITKTLRVEEGGRKGRDRTMETFEHSGQPGPREIGRGSLSYGAPLGTIGQPGPRDRERETGPWRPLGTVV